MTASRKILNGVAVHGVHGERLHVTFRRPRPRPFHVNKSSQVEVSERHLES